MPHPDGDKHHYIPRFYLKRWTNANGRLCEFSRPYDKVKARMTSPKGTGYIPNLYTLPNLDPDLADDWERRFFLRLDDRAALLSTNFART
jgi:hypothetical protein